MFGQVARSTFQGLLKWPDLMVFGLLSFGLTVALDAIFRPFWADFPARAGGGGALLAGIVGILAQQVVLTVGSFLIVVPASRLALARLRGGQMSLRESLQIRPLLAPILTYAALYAVISTVLSYLYLFVLFGGVGLSFAGQLTTTGVTGLSQVPTSMSAAAASLVLLIFLPLLLGWALANLLVGPVIAAEATGGWAAIARSAALVRRSWPVLAGLVVTIFAFACVLTLLLSYFVMASGDPLAVDAIAETGGLPELPFVMQALLTALLFMVGAIFNAAWYLAATGTD